MIFREYRELSPFTRPARETKRIKYPSLTSHALSFDAITTLYMCRDLLQYDRPARSLNADPKIDKINARSYFLTRATYGNFERFLRSCEFRKLNIWEDFDREKPRTCSWTRYGQVHLNSSEVSRNERKIHGYRFVYENLIEGLFVDRGYA